MEQGHSGFQSVCTCASNDRGKGKCLHFASFDLGFFFSSHTNALSPPSLSCPLRISGEGSGEWPLEEVWLVVSTGRSKLASALGRTGYNNCILSKRSLAHLRQLATSWTPEHRDISG